MCLPDLKHFIGIEPRQDAIEEAKKNISKLNRKDLKVKPNSQLCDNSLN